MKRNQVAYRSHRTLKLTIEAKFDAPRQNVTSDIKIWRHRCVYPLSKEAREIHPRRDFLITSRKTHYFLCSVRSIDLILKGGVCAFHERRKFVISAFTSKFRKNMVNKEEHGWIKRVSLLKLAKHPPSLLNGLWFCMQEVSKAHFETLGGRRRKWYFSYR